MRQEKRGLHLSKLPLTQKQTGDKRDLAYLILYRAFQHIAELGYKCRIGDKDVVLDEIHLSKLPDHEVKPRPTPETDSGIFLGT